MANNIKKKKYLDIDVVEAAKERMKHLYETYDKVIVDFSGGKDSTAMLYIAIEVAREIGKLPVETIYIDHEIEGIGTIKFLEEIAAMPEVDFYWYALPFRLRNAASFNAPAWYPWNPAEKEIWCRELPENAITTLEGYSFHYDEQYQHNDGLKYKALGVKQAMDFQEVCDLHAINYERKGLNVISLVGIRAQESMARYSIMTRKKNECYLSSSKPVAYPIYDWNATDVWKYTRESGLPYNTEYDQMNRTENYNQLNKQRVGSVFAEESLRSLHQWPTFYGAYWHKILERAEGVKTAWRYNNDGIYTGTKIEKEQDIKWSEYTKMLLLKMSPESRKLSINGITKIITWHKGRTDHPIAENEKEACPLTGISWEFLARICIRGDSKERNLQKVTSLAGIAQTRAGITRDEAVIKYGNDKYKQKYNEKKKATRRPINAA